jgi:hypothetical protein
MVEASTQEADRAEIRERFAKDADISETETMEIGKAVRRPRARTWRASR